MSLLDLINKKKKCLQKTVTRITLPSGRTVEEERNMDGTIKTTLVGQSLGFVGDYKPDLQVAAVLPDVLLGSQDVAHDLHLLRSYKVTHILNLATGVPNSYEELFTYKKIDIFDIPEDSILGIFDDSFEFIDNARSRGGCVFVHCNAGISRAASVVIGYIMKLQNVTFEKAFLTVKQKRPAIRPNDGFQRQLQEFEDILNS